jgi:hypothetical protein
MPAARRVALWFLGALAIPAALLLGAYLRILIALWAALGEVEAQCVGSANVRRRPQPPLVVGVRIAIRL